MTTDFNDPDASLEAFTEGSNDLYSLYCVSHEDVNSLITGAVEGDEYCETMLGLCETALIKWRLSGITCLICDKQFSKNASPPHAFLFLRRYDERGPVLVAGLCELDTKLPDLQNRIIAKYRELVMPDAEVIYANPAGHA